MRISHFINTFLIILLVLLPGCATQSRVTDADTTGNPPGRTEPAQADPHLNHVFAWIPRDRANTASVAEALVHIELGRAKDEAGKTLCGGGWPISGARITRSGPYPATAPVALGGYPAWYYHLSHEPGFEGCAAVPMATLYREIDNRLPPWISVRAGAKKFSATSPTDMTTMSTPHSRQRPDMQPAKGCIPSECSAGSASQ